MPHSTDRRSTSVTLQETCSLIHWSCQLHTQPSRLYSPQQHHRSSLHVCLSGAWCPWPLIGGCKCRFSVVTVSLVSSPEGMSHCLWKEPLNCHITPPLVLILISFWRLPVLSSFKKIISSIFLRKISTSQQNRLVFLPTFIPSLIRKSNLYLMKITVKKKNFRFTILNENSVSTAKPGPIPLEPVSQSGYDSVKYLICL